MTKSLGYVPQPNDYTCQSAAIAAAIGSTAVNQVRADLEDIGTPGDPYVMGQYLKPRVQEYTFYDKASINDMIAWLKQGYRLITHGYFSGSGHVVSLVGVGDGYFIVDDPYGEFDAPSWSYTSNENGNDVHYSYLCIYSACMASYSRDQAREVYQSKQKVDKDYGNAWVHKIKN